MNAKKTFSLVAIVLAVFTALALIPGPIQAQVYSVKNYFAACSAANCDNVLNIKGTLAIDSGATVTGIITTPSNATYKIARGTVTLDGSNPSSATTGLATIVACTVENKRSTAPGDDPVGFTIATAAVAGRLDVYAWKHDGTDPTLVASTDNDDTIDWICVGT